MRFRWHYKRKKAEKKTEWEKINSIHDRPAEVDERKALGNWESDTVLGQRKTGGIATYVERVSGFLLASKLAGGGGEEYANAMIAAFGDLPQKARLSFTVDRGGEFTHTPGLPSSLRPRFIFAILKCLRFFPLSQIFCRPRSTPSTTGPAKVSAG
jgi:IS30 family transposase